MKVANPVVINALLAKNAEVEETVASNADSVKDSNGRSVKVGDKVCSVSGEKVYGKRETCTITKIDGDKVWSTDDASGSSMYTAHWNPGAWVLVNSCAYNAVQHHNFKVGDEVVERVLYTPSKSDKMTVVKIDGDNITCRSVFAGGNYEYSADELKHWDKRINSRAYNAEFKVGDIVKDKSFPLSGKFRIIQVNPDRTYNIKPIRGGAVTSEYEKYLVLANSEDGDAIACNTKEVEISLRYASRAQSAMRDAVRLVHGASISSSNTVDCVDRDSAEEVMDIIKGNAGIPEDEIWINSKRRPVAKNSASQTTAVQASRYFHDAWGSLSGCLISLDRLRAYGQPNGFDDADAKKCKDWADKVYGKIAQLRNQLKQGDINSI